MSEISEGRQHKHLVKRQASAANYPWCLHHRRVLVNKHIDSWLPPTMLLMFDRGPAFSATCLKSQKEGSTNISSKDKLQLQITLGAFITECASTTMLKIKRGRRNATLQGTGNQGRRQRFDISEGRQHKHLVNRQASELPFGAFITGLLSRRVLVNKHIDSRMPPTILLMFDRGPAFSATCLKSQKEGSTNISSKDKLQLQINNYAEDQAWKTQRYIARD